MNHLYWMQQAYQQALQAQLLGEVPVGAVIVDAHDQLLAAAFNRVISDQDPSAHAEVLAIRQASKTIGNYRLTGTRLYVTLEPCAMCAGALVQARIDHLIFATRDFKAGAAGSVYNLLRGYPLNHKVLIDEGPLQQECSHLLTSFFRQMPGLTD